MERHPAVGLLSQRLPLAGHITPPVPTVSPDLPWSCNASAHSNQCTRVPQSRTMQYYNTPHRQTETIFHQNRSVLRENGPLYTQNGTSHQQNGTIFERGARAESCRPQNRNNFPQMGVLQPAPITTPVSYHQQTYLQQKENFAGSQRNTFAYSDGTRVCDNIWRQKQLQSNDRTYDRYFTNQSSRPRVPVLHNSEDNTKTSLQTCLQPDSQLAGSTIQAILNNIANAHPDEFTLKRRSNTGTHTGTELDTTPSMDYTLHRQVKEAVQVPNSTKNLLPPVSITDRQYPLSSNFYVNFKKPVSSECTASMPTHSHRFIEAPVPFTTNVHGNMSQFPYAGTCNRNVYSSIMDRVKPGKGQPNPLLEKILFGVSRNTPSNRAVYQNHVISEPTSSYYVHQSKLRPCDSYLKSTSDFCDTQSCSSRLDLNKSVQEVNQPIGRDYNIYLGKQEVERESCRNTSLLSDSFVKPSQLLNNPENIERDAMLKGYDPVKDDSIAKMATECVNSDKNIDCVKCKSSSEQEENPKFEKVKFKYFRRHVASEVMGKKEKRIRRKLRKLKHGVHVTTQTDGIRKIPNIKKDPDGSGSEVSKNSVCTKVQTPLLESNSLPLERSRLEPEVNMPSLENNTLSESSSEPTSAYKELWSYVKNITQNKVPDHVINDALLELSKGANEGMTADHVFKLLFNLLDLKVDET